ncbi:hypothetical protein VX037_17115 [Gordonia sp. Z-3]|uniref:hypothetical protein n=1 Tax=Gordonia sp. Z-3 TaxID=3115408 RepID=UPI002E2D39A0|nr:hypothetical protein [Gordonia sp. Z-3]MED5802753.1 hypothetical protein [Gordonia sp. Z-3]
MSSTPNRAAGDHVVSDTGMQLVARALRFSDDAAMNELWTRFDGLGALAQVSERVGLRQMGHLSATAPIAADGFGQGIRLLAPAATAASGVHVGRDGDAGRLIDKEKGARRECEEVVVHRYRGSTDWSAEARSTTVTVTSSWPNVAAVPRAGDPSTDTTEDPPVPTRSRDTQESTASDDESTTNR